MIIVIFCKEKYISFIWVVFLPYVLIFIWSLAMLRETTVVQCSKGFPSYSGVSKRWFFAKKYERFVYQTKTWIALRKVIEKWTKKGFWKKSKISRSPPKKIQFLQLNLEMYLRTVKLPYLAENGCLNNFDFHGWLSKSDIFWVMAVANSWICTVSEETM